MRQTCRAPRALFVSLILVACALIVAPAFAESRYCADLRAQIGRAGAGQAQRYRAMAAKQRGEYARLSAKARAMQCDRQQFLVFGSAPPPQCDPINARLRALYDSIAQYESAATSGDGGARDDLVARYNAECRDVVEARAGRPRNFFEELFGLAPPDETTGMREVPVEPPASETRDAEIEAEDDRPAGGSQAICVRTCDGGFFPMITKARSSNLDDLETLCKALCPNAEVKLYTRSPWGALEGAVSVAGEPYSDLENAFKYQKSYDSTCGCKPPDKSWAEALQEAESILAERHKKDQVVTEEEAEKLSRPFAPNDPRLKKPKGGTAPETPLAQDEAAPLLKPSVVDGASTARETYREIVGPDGVKRRVRVVAPSL